MISKISFDCQSNIAKQETTQDIQYITNKPKIKEVSRSFFLRCVIVRFYSHILFSSPQNKKSLLRLCFTSEFGIYRHSCIDSFRNRCFPLPSIWWSQKQISLFPKPTAFSVLNTSVELSFLISVSFQSTILNAFPLQPILIPIIPLLFQQGKLILKEEAII